MSRRWQIGFTADFPNDWTEDRVRRYLAYWLTSAAGAPRDIYKRIRVDEVLHPDRAWGAVVTGGPIDVRDCTGRRQP